MTIIVRHGEIFTKSPPVRREFIRQLVQNINIALPKTKVVSKHWRIYVDSGKTKASQERAVKTLQRVFGLISISPTKECSISIQAIKNCIAKNYIDKAAAANSFAIKTKRIDKNIEIRSKEINEKIGAYVKDSTGTKVDLTNPGITIYVELYNDKAYVFTEKIKGPGGLPLGSARGAVSIPGKSVYSALAGWMMMKRGVLVEPVLPELKKWNYCASSRKNILGAITETRDIQHFLTLQKKTDMPLYCPLIGLSEKQIENLKEKVL